MGCDIHVVVEVYENGQWVSVDDPDDDFDLGRNYDLFAILADVRNGCGFAGIKTGEGFVPLALPRGFPDDASLTAKSMKENWIGDGHSHSYCTVSELLAYDWTQKTKKCGVVSIAGWAEWYSRGKPTAYSGDVCGRDIARMTPEEIEDKWLEYKETFKLDEWVRPDHNSNEFSVYVNSDKNVYIRVEWEVSYAEQVQWFLWSYIPKLLRLGKPENVRLVYLFDN